MKETRPGAESEARDEIARLTDVPASEVGAPAPLVLANESTVFLLYFGGYAEPQDYDTYFKGLFENKKREEKVDPLQVAVIEFTQPYATQLGPPNDEAISGHPLYGKGLRPYDAFEVQRSSWIRRLERMNAVHPRHDPGVFDSLRHFIFTFHDSTFECVSDGYRASLHTRSRESVVVDAVTRLWSQFD